MKKIKCILLIVLLFPVFVNASCNYDKLDEDTKLSNDIDYELYYSTSTKKFNIRFYNLYENLYLIYNNKSYHGDSKHEAYINGIVEGTSMNISIYSNAKDCDGFIRTLPINLEYFNDFYGTANCEKYKDNLTICSSQFLPYKTDYNMVAAAIRNYESGYTVEETTEKEKVEEVSLFANIQEFVNEWGILMILMILSSLITATIFRIKYRKIKHGI